MEGDSDLNIIFPDTLVKMVISPSDLQPSRVGFHGFVPGRPIRPIGRIELEVIFGNEDNFRSEQIQFKVALFRSGYNAIFSRPAYARFMTVLSYAYLLLKMSGPNATITAHGSPERALEAEVANVELAETTLASAELRQIKQSVDTSITTLPA